MFPTLKCHAYRCSSSSLHSLLLFDGQNRKGVVECLLSHLSNIDGVVFRCLCSSSTTPNTNTTTTTAAEDDGTKQQRRALRVAVIGSPNVGKSALTNALIRTNVCAVSSQIDTTRRNTMTALTEDMCQLVVVDSPGLIGTGHARRMAGVSSDEPILAGPTHAIERAEHILVVHDVTLPGQFLNHRLLYFLHRFAHIPSCLVLNKVDLVTDRGELLKLAHTLTEGTVGGQAMKTEQVKLGKLGAIIARNRANVNGRTNEEDNDAVGGTTFGIHPTERKGRDEEWHRIYTKLISLPAHKGSWTLTRKLFGNQLGWPNFSALFFASALRGDGIDALRHHLRSLAQGVDKWKLTPDAISTADPRMLCAEHMRSALLNRCPAYIGYALRTRITEWEANEQGTLRIAVDVFCDKERWVRVVGRVVDEIEREQCQLLARLFNMRVQLRLFVCGPDQKRRHFLDGEEDQQQEQESAANNNGTGERYQRKMWQQLTTATDEDDHHMTFEQQVISAARAAKGGEGVTDAAAVVKGGRRRRKRF